MGRNCEDRPRACGLRERREQTLQNVLGATCTFWLRNIVVRLGIVDAQHLLGEFVAGIKNTTPWAFAAVFMLAGHTGAKAATYTNDAGCGDAYEVFKLKHEDFAFYLSTDSFGRLDERFRCLVRPQLFADTNIDNQFPHKGTREIVLVGKRRDKIGDIPEITRRAASRIRFDNHDTAAMQCYTVAAPYSYIATTFVGTPLLPYIYDRAEQKLVRSMDEREVPLAVNGHMIIKEQLRLLRPTGLAQDGWQQTYQNCSFLALRNAALPSQCVGTNAEGVNLLFDVITDKQKRDEQQLEWLRQTFWDRALTQISRACD
jgi:hypothetical protein